MSIENELQQRNEELRIRNYENLALKEENHNREQAFLALRAELDRLVERMGRLEHQRNHARWKAGVRKRKMREMRKTITDLRTEIMRSIYVNQADYKVIARHGLTEEALAEYAKGPENLGRAAHE